MARRAIKVIDIVELLAHWHAGRRISELHASLGVDPKTVRKYIAPAVAEGMAPGGAPLSAEQWTERVERWFPELADGSLRRTSWAEIEPHRERIAAWLGVVTIATIHQRLRDEAGLAVSESSLRRYIEARFDEAVARRAVRVLRDTPPAGEEAQVDYGLLGRWIDPASQQPRRVWGFLMVLPYSRMQFLRPVLRMDEASWVEAHVAAFEFFGGVPQRLIPDNLKTGVVKPDLYDPIINRAFGECAAHFGCLVDPARSRKPRDKAAVERRVPFARDSFFAGRADSFASVPAMQQDAVRWCREVANRRASRALDGRSPQEVFDAEERALLLPLPAASFELARWSTPRVNPDVHIKVGRALYSVPWRLIGQRVDARESAHTVEVFLDGKLVKTHPRIERGRQTDHGDYPPEKIAFFMRTPAWCRHRADELGAAVAELVGVLMEVNALYRLRQAQGVLHLADRYGAERLDAACRRALAVGDPSYRTVKGILAAGTEHADDEPPERPPRAPAHLHGQAALFGIGGAR